MHSSPARVNADDRCVGAWLSRPHPGFVVSEWFKARLCPALVESSGIFDGARPDRLAGNGELSAVELRLPGIDPDSVLQIGQVRRGSLSLGDCRAQGVQECALLNWVLVGVLGEEPCRLGCLVTDERPSWPSPAGDQVSKPLCVVIIDAVPLLAQAVGKSASVGISLLGSQVANPLILLAPTQQLAPEVFIHITIATERPCKSKGKYCCSNRPCRTRSRARGLLPRDRSSSPTTYCLSDPDHVAHHWQTCVADQLSDHNEGELDNEGGRRRRSASLIPLWAAARLA